MNWSCLDFDIENETSSVCHELKDILLSKDIFYISCVELSKAEYAVSESNFLIRKCRQASGDNLEVLQHIIFYLSTKRP